MPVKTVVAYAINAYQHFSTDCSQAFAQKKLATKMFGNRACRNIMLYGPMAALLGFSSLANALGLGEINLRSHLNQPLAAEIELLQVRDFTASEIIVDLAPQKEFLNAGVERSYFLQDLRFEVVIKPNGEATVLVRSVKSVQEPYLNFLVEILWPAGRLLREYTLLMDPPVYSDKVAESVSLSRRNTGSSSISRASGPSKQVVRSAAPRNTRYASGARNYRTRANDSLWNVAAKLRPGRDITIHQSMLAIQRSNPDAFDSNNINRLKRNQVLRVPTRDEMAKLSHQDAVKEVARQNKAWKERLYARKNNAAPKAVTKATISDQTVSEQTKPAVATGNKLRIVSSESASKPTNASGVGGAGGGASGSMSSADSELVDTLREEVDRATIEKSELTGRLGELTDQVNKSESIINLQNDQIKALTAKLQELERQAAVTAFTPDASPIDQREKTLNSDASSLLAETAVDEPSQAVSEPSSFVEDPEEATPEELAAAQLASAATEASVGVESEVDATQVEELATVSSPTLFEKLMRYVSDPLYAGIAFIGILILGLLWVLFGNKNEYDDEFDLDEELAFDNFDTSEPNSNPLSNAVSKNDELKARAFGASTGVGVTGSDSLFATDDHNVASTTENDSSLEAALDHLDASGEAATSAEAISEADIYLSYGRQDQAIEVLDKAVKLDKTNPELYLKLMDAYAELDDRNGFEDTRQILADQGLVDAFEDRISAIGQKFLTPDPFEESFFDTDEQNDGESDSDRGSPESQLMAFEEGSATPDSLASLNELESNLTGDFGLPGLSTTTMEQADSSSPMFESGKLGFSLDAAEEELNSAIAADGSSVGDETLLSNSGIDQPHSDTALDDFEGVGFSAEALLETESLEIEKNQLQDSDGLDDLVADLDSAFESLDIPNAESLPESQGRQGDDLDFFESSSQEIDSHDDLVGSTALASKSSSLDENDEDISQLLGSIDPSTLMDVADEVATKLDLARAYIDMGDKDGAKDILGEVIEEGSESQQEEAKELMARVG